MENQENKNIEINESNSAKRLKMLGDSTSEEIHKESDKDVKGDYFANVWYRNKWAIILGAVGIVIFIILCFTLCGQEKTDVSVMYVGPEYLVHKAEGLNEKFEMLSDDYNGDGEIHTSFPTLVYQTPKQVEILKNESPEKIIPAKDNNNALGQFQTQVMGGELVIYLIDPDLYENLAHASQKISDVLGYELSDDMMFNDSAVYFAKTDFAKYFTEFGALPEDTIMCVIRTIGTDSDYYDASVDMFKRIIEFKAQ